MKIKYYLIFNNSSFLIQFTMEKKLKRLIRNFQKQTYLIIDLLNIFSIIFLLWIGRYFKTIDRNIIQYQTLTIKHLVEHLNFLTIINWVNEHLTIQPGNRQLNGESRRNIYEHTESKTRGRVFIYTDLLPPTIGCHILHIRQ